MNLNWRKLCKYTAYTVEILLAFIIQSTPYCLPEIFGEKALLLLPLAVSIAVLEEEIPAMIFGLICGLLADSAFNGTIGFFSIFFVVLCYISGRFMTDYIKMNLLSVMLLALGSIVLVFGFHFLLYYVLEGYGHIFHFFVEHYLIRMIYTLAVMPVFYGLNKRISTKFQRSRL